MDLKRKNEEVLAQIKMALKYSQDLLMPDDDDDDEESDSSSEDSDDSDY